MAAMGLEYVKDDMNGNALKMLEYTTGMSQDLTSKAKTDLINAIKEGECSFEHDENMMVSNMKFHICVMKTCVRSMVSP
ncbi:hypothetical protein SK128_013514 [Halocaridina rubra]|uniref:Uncharacterized protein n=1 Tax=Halocaridina rubra TaxID=373956 RepID=A0AAN8ZR87_HALRR